MMLPYNGVISGLYTLLIKAILCPRFGGYLQLATMLDKRQYL